MADDGVAPDAVATVIVALDGSAASERALPIGEWLGQRLGASVEVISAVRTEGDVAARANELSHVSAIDGAPSVSVVVEDDPAKAIHHAVAQAQPAVVC